MCLFRRAHQIIIIEEGGCSFLSLLLYKRCHQRLYLDKEKNGKLMSRVLKVIARSIQLLYNFGHNARSNNMKRRYN